MKKIDKYEAFEKSFKSPVPGRKQKVVTPQNKEGSLIFELIFLPFLIVAKIIKFYVLGLNERDYGRLSYAGAYSALSGMFMLFSSLLGFFFINDIGMFLKSSDLTSDYATFLNAFLIVFFLVQIIRGSGFMSGYNIGQAGAIDANKWHNPNLPSSSTYSSSTSSTNSRPSEIDDFTGYVNSKMSLMSNSGKESYVRRIFGGK
jgi:hypothetical protein